MFIDLRAVQPEKALSPIIVTLSGMLTEVRAIQPENAPFPMFVTLLGMQMVLSEVQPRNVKLLMLVRPLRTLTSESDVQFSKILSPVRAFLMEIVIEVIDVQPKNTLEPK